MQYAVPQFIEVEDRVIGKLTVRQFAYLLGAGLLSAAAYSVFDFGLFIFTAIILVGIAVAFAFVKINGRNLEKFAVAFVQYTFRPNLRLWAKDFETKSESFSNSYQRPIEVKRDDEFEEVNKSRLRDLAVLLDTSSRFIEEKTEEETTNERGTNTATQSA